MMTEAISVVGTDHDLFFCRSERCPRIELHRRHDINRCIDKLVIRAIPSGQVVQAADLNSETTQGVQPSEIIKSLRRLLYNESIRAIHPDDDRTQQAVAFYLNDGVLDAVPWSTTALAYRPKSKEGKQRLNALDESILRMVGRYVLKVFWQIYRDVQHDYGSVADRTVYRRLAHLCEIEELHRISMPLVNDGGYVLPGSPLIDDMPTAYEQIRCAHLERRAL